MGLDTKIYIIAIMVVVSITTLISIGIMVSGRKSPGTRLGKIWPKVMAAVIAAGLVISIVLGGLAFYNRGDPPLVNAEPEIVDDGKFNLETYIGRNIDDFEVKIEYGEEFIPDYDSSLLTLITEDVDIGDNAGVKTVSLLFQDNYEEFHTLEYKVIIEDNHPPELKGVRDIHLDNGTPFVVGDLGITAEDPVDGILEVQIDGSLLTTLEGVYPMEAYALDKNLNKTSKGFFVIVNGANETANFEKAGEDLSSPSTDPDGETPDADIPSSEDVTEVAKEVIAGKYGDGIRRQYLLAKEGYNQDDVQDEVNRLVAEGYEPPAGSIVSTPPEIPSSQTQSNGPEKEVKSGSKRQFGDSTDEVDLQSSDDKKAIAKSQVDKESLKTNLLNDNKEIDKSKDKANDKSDSNIKKDLDLTKKQDEEISKDLLGIDDIAKLVIRGDFGNGQERIDKLTAKGYDSKTVQDRVDSYKGILY